MSRVSADISKSQYRPYVPTTEQTELQPHPDTYIGPWSPLPEKMTNIRQRRIGDDMTEEGLRLLLAQRTVYSPISQGTTTEDSHVPSMVSEVATVFIQRKLQSPILEEIDSSSVYEGDPLESMALKPRVDEQSEKQTKKGFSKITLSYEDRENFNKENTHRGDAHSTSILAKLPQEVFPHQSGAATTSGQTQDMVVYKNMENVDNEKDTAPAILLRRKPNCASKKPEELQHKAMFPKFGHKAATAGNGRKLNNNKDDENTNPRNSSLQEELFCVSKKREELQHAESVSDSNHEASIGNDAIIVNNNNAADNIDLSTFGPDTKLSCASKEPEELQHINLSTDTHKAELLDREDHNGEAPSFTKRFSTVVTALKRNMSTSSRKSRGSESYAATVEDDPESDTNTLSQQSGAMPSHSDVANEPTPQQNNRSSSAPAPRKLMKRSDPRLAVDIGRSLNAEEARIGTPPLEFDNKRASMMSQRTASPKTTDPRRDRNAKKLPTEYDTNNPRASRSSSIASTSESAMKRLSLKAKVPANKRFSTATTASDSDETAVGDSNPPLPEFTMSVNPKQTPRSSTSYMKRPSRTIPSAKRSSRLGSSRTMETSKNSDDDRVDWVSISSLKMLLDAEKGIYHKLKSGPKDEYESRENIERLPFLVTKPDLFAKLKDQGPEDIQLYYQALPVELRPMIWIDEQTGEMGFYQESKKRPLMRSILEGPDERGHRAHFHQGWPRSSEEGEDPYDSDGSESEADRGRGYPRPLDFADHCLPPDSDEKELYVPYITKEEYLEHFWKLKEPLWVEDNTLSSDDAELLAWCEAEIKEVEADKLLQLYTIRHKLDKEKAKLNKLNHGAYWALNSKGLSAVEDHGVDAAQAAILDAESLHEIAWTWDVVAAMHNNKILGYLLTNNPRRWNNTRILLGFECAARADALMEEREALGSDDFDGLTGSVRPEIYTRKWETGFYTRIKPNVLNCPQEVKYNILLQLIPPELSPTILLTPESSIANYWNVLNFIAPQGVIGYVWGLLESCRQLRSETMAFFLTQHRFHIALNCLQTLFLAPILYKWTPRYIHMIQNITIELDFTWRQGNWHNDAAMFKSNGVEELKTLLEMIIPPMGKASCIKKLEIIAKRWDGFRPSIQQMPDGIANRATVPYCDPENTKIAGMIVKHIGLSGGVPIYDLRLSGFPDEWALKVQELLLPAEERDDGIPNPDYIPNYGEERPEEPEEAWPDLTDDAPYLAPMPPSRPSSPTSKATPVPLQPEQPLPESENGNKAEAERKMVSGTFEWTLNDERRFWESAMSKEQPFLNLGQHIPDSMPATRVSYARALYDFDGTGDGKELPLKAGDLIAIRSFVMKDWWFGLQCDGTGKLMIPLQSGLVPLPYITTALEFPETVRALYGQNSNPKDPRQLPMNRGDIIMVSEPRGKNWWNGELKGRKGIFPRVYADYVDDEIKDRCHTVHKASGGVITWPALRIRQINHELEQRRISAATNQSEPSSASPPSPSPAWRDHNNVDEKNIHSIKPVDDGPAEGETAKEKAARLKKAKRNIQQREAKRRKKERDDAEKATGSSFILEQFEKQVIIECEWQAKADAKVARRAVREKARAKGVYGGAYEADDDVEEGGFNDEEQWEDSVVEVDSKVYGVYGIKQ